MSFFRKNSRLNTRYETEISLALLLLFLLLFLLNFGSLYLVTSYQRELQQENSRKLTALGKVTEQLLESGSGLEVINKKLSEYNQAPGIRYIDVYLPNGILKYSSRIRISALKGPQLWELPQELEGNIAGNTSFSAQINSASSTGLFSDFYYPILAGPEQERYWVVIRSEAGLLLSLKKNTRLIYWMHTVGFFCAFLITLFLIRRALEPYRLMKKRAIEENLLEHDRKGGSSDMVVETFQRTITELRDKEKILQQMYHDTSQQAQELSRLNEYILRGMPTGVIICNPEGEITKVNQAAVEILEVKEAELVGRHHHACFGESGSLSLLINEALVKHKTCLGQEVEFYLPRNKKLWLEVNISLIKNEEDKLLGVTLLLTNITELKRLRETLVFKEKMAGLGEMSAGLAHQLRNSMGSIYGFANLLRKSLKEPNDLNQIVDEIRQETKALENLVQKFLSFSRPLQVQSEKLNLSEILLKSFKAAEEQAAWQKIRFNLATADNLPEVWGDKLLIQECFRNLLQNSFEAISEKGDITAKIESDGKSPNKSQLVVTITDTGAGIPPKEIDKIFDPFYSGKPEGTGLGLSVVKKIIDQHDGRIEVESRKDKGTTFRIWLPAGRDAIATEKDSQTEKHFPLAGAGKSS
ncbi:MAG: ATP-binding protein [candidate division Zixibacteria bacterium]|nr:ATP-binding protein [candidate division Zixibacteria bacterium]